MRIQIPLSLALGALLAGLCLFAHGLLARRQTTRLKRQAATPLSPKPQEISR